VTQYVYPLDAGDFLRRLPLESVDLFCIDPPYFGIVKDSWDNQWPTVDAYVAWLVDLLSLARTRVKAGGSLVMFQGIGKHTEHPIFDVCARTERAGWTFRNWITWQKRRAYGKSHDYLFCREEILWFSASTDRTSVTFNVPYLDEKRGYDGWDPAHPAKSEFKRVSNVWSDIPELMRPQRVCQKPEPLLERIIKTHSNPGNVVVDFFSGYGSTGIVAKRLGRAFVGCEAIPEDAAAADERIKATEAT